MLKLKLQYFDHLQSFLASGSADSFEKALKLEKIESKRRRGRQRISWLDSITNSMNMNLNNFQEIVKDRGAWCVAVHGVTKSRTQLSN